MKYYGGDEHATRRAATALGLTTQTVYGWKDTGIPWLRQLHIESETKGKLRAEKQSGSDNA